ncbi:diguanylate cyclase, partial [Vibrio vulnificus]
ARFGGEEFCIQSCQSYDDFVTRLEHMRQRVEKTTITHKAHNIHITISIGVTSLQDELENQIKEADGYLYQAKANGRNQVVSR